MVLQPGQYPVSQIICWLGLRRPVCIVAVGAGGLLWGVRWGAEQAYCSTLDGTPLHGQRYAGPPGHEALRRARLLIRLRVCGIKFTQLDAAR